MIRAVYIRKRKVQSFLRSVDKMSPRDPHKHERMCYSYVFVFASLEFMLESVIRGWTQYHLEKHKNARYRGKKSVENIVNILQQNSNLSLKKNNTINYKKVCDLLGLLAGTTAKDDFKLRIATLPAGANDVISRVERISLFRHHLAHGLYLPEDMSPNITELEADFLFLYSNFIVPIDRVLTRR